MTITINGSTGITTPEITLDNTAADGGQVVLKSSGYSNWNIDNYSGRLRGYYGSTEYWTVDASGNMGIGTSSPAAKLDVSGNRFRIGNASSDPGIELFNGSTIKGYLFHNTASDVVTLRHSSGSGLNMDSLGRAVIPYSSSSSISAVGCYNETTGSGANMVIVSNGYMVRSTSSLKYKKNVQNASYGISDVMRLRPVTYESKNESEEGIVYGGLIAEEVHEQGLTYFVQYAEDGTPDAISYGNMVSLAFKAIQELKAIVDEQAAKITALENK